MALKNQKYKYFSSLFHKKTRNKPLVIQFELTHRCPLHCQHCYNECFNGKLAAKNELSTGQIKCILDKCKEGGVLWICFTGGDPLMRRDFSQIYTYAKKLGFIITIFSSLIPLNEKLLKILKKYPPFNIETTLNAATPKKYTEITKTNYFKKHLNNIQKLLKIKLPLKIKTMVTRQNISQVHQIHNLLGSLGIKFRPSTLIYPRLNHDTNPCGLRLTPKRASLISKTYGDFDEEIILQKQEKFVPKVQLDSRRKNKLFKCDIATQYSCISPQGKMHACNLLRKPGYDLLKKNNTLKRGFYQTKKYIELIESRAKNAVCKTCSYKKICNWCPARAYLEKNDFEKPIKYFCELSKISLKNASNN